MISPVLPTYKPAELTFVAGNGVYLQGNDGHQYLDFTSGIGVTCLGHGHPHLVAALQHHAEKPWHVSNIFQIPEQKKLAQRLVERSFADTVFFCNSGLEAVEAGIKTARRYFHVRGQPHRHRLICAENGFHGRSLATIAAAGQAKMMEGFDPPMPGFDHVPFGDHAALQAAIGPETAAILIEPVQGEGGIHVADKEYMRALRESADAHDLLLFFDEVQCGMGRTGRFFAHEWSGVQPDIMAVAKGIGGGFPLGAMLATSKAAQGMTLGTHGSTYGGNPLAMAVGNAVLDIVLNDDFLDHVRAVGFMLRQGLRALVTSHPKIIKDVRGLGLMVGLECIVENTVMIDALRSQGLLSVRAGSNTVRMLPPLITEQPHIEEALAAVESACIQLEENGVKEPRHFRDLDRLSTPELQRILSYARGFKNNTPPGNTSRPLVGKTLAMLFEKPSTRTRISFEVGMQQMGGSVVVLEQSSSQLGRGEAISDTARVLSRYVDIIMLRTTSHDNLDVMCREACVPVINGLTDYSHPCQIIADILTFEERLGPIHGRHIAWVGDGNNVAVSWIHAAARFGFHLSLACPQELLPDQTIIDWANHNGGHINIAKTPADAVTDADSIVTDTWVSMGQDAAEKTACTAPELSR